ncbi:MAG TPA: sulfatase [Thermoanaerobaculia bacterium]|nr:sulfatase [Thermoanaerobaculia bacterium]
MRRTALFLASALAATLILACRGEGRPAAPAHDGPIVLITIDALRADVLGPKLTPHLHRLASESDWAGRAVSASSWTVPSMASLFTGLQPWSVQSWSSDRAVLRDDLVTLPEALKAKGYRTSAFRTNHWLQKVYGYAQGFDEFRFLAQGKRAENHLEKLGPGRELVWIHILQPHAPYVRRPYLEDRLDGAPPGLPQKVRPADLEPYYDPAVPLPPEREQVFRAMYGLNAAYADDLLGRMVASLRKSGQWDRTLLVVTSDHGEEFGEMGQIAHGGNLGRQLVEVPLMIKLPAGFPRKLALGEGQRPATARVRATLLEAAGWEPEEETAPSLFHEAEEAGVLSELYSGNGVNHFSYVEGDLQLLWESRFSPPEPEYYRARYEGVVAPPDPPLSEPSKVVFGRLEEAFARTMPLSGWRGAEPRLTLWRWTADGSERVDDPKETERMARRLRSAWLAANGQEKVPGKNTGKKPQLTPEQEAEMRALGYLR